MIELQIISRKDAKAAGLKRYFTGEPCKHGHFAERWTSGAQCLVCHAARSLEYSRTLHGREKAAEWRNSHPDEWRGYQRRYYERHHEQIIEKKREHRRDNIDAIRKYSRRWAYDHSSGYRGPARPCIYCGSPFDSPSHAHRFCSVKCRANDFHHRASIDLRDCYVRTVLRADGILKGADIPQPLVDAKRQHLLLQRELRKRKYHV